MLGKLLILSTLLSIGSSTYFCSNLQECEQLSEARKQRQVERLELFTQLRSNFTTTTDNVGAITNMTFEELLDQLQTRKLKAVDTLTAFMTKALDAAEQYNCVATFIPQALERAEELDNSPTVKGPLHGLPVCVSENIDVKGLDSTLGYSKRIGQRARRSAAIVTSLEDLGAVPFCKTNVPQTLVTLGSDNPIFGRTRNPLKSELATGGSLSGAACLVAAGALKIAPGTDLGGSARYAAHNTGTSGLKITEGRLSVRGIVPPIPNLVGLEQSPGFVAERPQTISTVLKALIEKGRQSTYDPVVLPVAWNSMMYESTSPLRIGYIGSMAIFPSMGSTEKTVKAAAAAMERRGHTIVPIPIIDSFSALDMYVDLLTADGGDYFKRMLNNDAVAPSFETYRILLSLPPWKRSLLSFLPFSERVRLMLSAGVDTQRSEKLWEKISDRNELRYDILKLMERESLDAIITPVLPFPAPKNDISAHLFPSTVYTSIWNLVQFPAGSVPFGIEKGENITEYDDQRDFSLNVAKTNFNSSVGMPIGIQVIGKPFHDELVLRLMKELEAARIEGETSQADKEPNVKLRSEIATNLGVTESPEIYFEDVDISVVPTDVTGV